MDFPILDLTRGWAGLGLVLVNKTKCLRGLFFQVLSPKSKSKMAVTKISFRSQIEVSIQASTQEGIRSEFGRVKMVMVKT